MKAKELMPTPYYEDKKSGITLYCGDCREILPLLSEKSIDLVLTDPPYGIGADKNLRANKQHGSAVAPSKDYGVGNWDSSVPTQDLLDTVCSLGSRSIVWGGNYFEFPPQPCWLVWDKDNGNSGYADCELAWTNLPRAVRKFRWRWMEMLQEKAGRYKEERVHPTQKPLALMEWCIELADNAQLILDPFCGSGTTLVAAKQLGRKAIGIEISEKYCQIAVDRLRQMELFT